MLGMTSEALAGWITAIGTIVLAIAASVQLPLIAKQMRSLAEQLRLSREAERNAERRVREWEKLKACQHYDFDPVLDGATQRLWEASEQGRNYRQPAINLRDMICVLNYFDGLAVGIEQNLYIEKVVRNHLGLVMNHADVNFIRSRVIQPGGLETLLTVHGRWFQQPRGPEYQSPSPEN